MRAFLAIDVGTTDEPPPLVASPGAPPHLTLRFLGDLDEADQPALVALMRPIARRTAPFRLIFEGVGAFPSRTDPRVVWMGVTDGRAEVTRLASEISDALNGLGLPPDSPAFVPHLTLFRVRSGQDRLRARLLLDGTNPVPGERRIRVLEFVLKESTLTRAGPVHRTVERFRFGGAEPH